MYHLLLTFLASSFLLSCDGGVPQSGQLYGVNHPNTTLGTISDNLELNFEESPIPLSSSDILFVGNQAYDKLSETTMDIFMRAQGGAQPVLIYYHGGDLRSGDKDEVYSEPEFVNKFLNLNFTVVNVNYRLVSSSQGVGIRDLLRDCTRVLQYIRYYDSQLNIDSNNIILAGEGIGATIALWVGLSDEMMNLSSVDPIRRMSSRVKGVIALDPASGFDIVDWESVLSKDSFQAKDHESVIMDMFKLSSYSSVFSSTVSNLRSLLRITQILDRSDPPIMVSSTKSIEGIPLDFSESISHPRHGWAIKKKAEQLSLKGGVYYVPEILGSEGATDTPYAFAVKLVSYY